MIEKTSHYSNPSIFPSFSQKADYRAPAAGLGSAGSNYGAPVGGGSSSYRENVKSVARARFQQMFQNKD